MGKGLVDYIKSTKKKGFSEDSIIGRLIQEGHDKSEIDKALDLVRNENLPKEKLNLKKIFISIFIILIITFVGYIIYSKINLYRNNIDINNDFDEDFVPNDITTTSPWVSTTKVFKDYEKECDGWNCCEDSDCDDGNPNTRDICSGLPLTCYAIQTEICKDCELDGTVSFDFSGGGGGGGGGGDSGSVPSEPASPPVEPCFDDTDCGSLETCENGACLGIKCSTIGGRNCDWDQTCEGYIQPTSDNSRCCIGECKIKQLDCISNIGEIASVGCDPGCVECRCEPTGGNVIDNTINWDLKICLNMPTISEYLWIDYPMNVCPEGSSTPGCLCVNDFCGIDTFQICESGICKE